jgi:hypothetical protein
MRSSRTFRAYGWLPMPMSQYCGSGSGIGCLFDPWIRDPGWEKVSIRIRDEQPGSYFLELRKHFFLLFLGLKYLNSLMRIQDPGWRQFGSGIRDGKNLDPGSGINIPDPQHCNVAKVLGVQSQHPQTEWNLIHGRCNVPCLNKLLEK